ncbi:hypothetical protein BHM03_00053467, partial [Ensete ventricosum]
VTQEWVDEGELPRERTKNRRWRRPYNVSQIVSTNESHGGDLIIQRYVGAIGELDCFSAHIHLREPGMSEDKAESTDDKEWMLMRGNR